MTINPCPECQNPVSSKASACSHCGSKVHSASQDSTQKKSNVRGRLKPLFWPFLWLSVLTVLLVVIGNNLPQSAPSTSMSIDQNLGWPSFTVVSIHF